MEHKLKSVMPADVQIVVNDAPVANDDSAATQEDTAVTIDVLCNATDANGDTLLVIARLFSSKR